MKNGNSRNLEAEESDSKKAYQETKMFLETFSEELTRTFFQGNPKKFQEVVEDMIESLDKTKETMKKAYFQVNYEKHNRKRGPKGSGGGP